MLPGKQQCAFCDQMVPVVDQLDSKTIVFIFLGIAFLLITHQNYYQKMIRKAFNLNGDVYYITEDKIFQLVGYLGIMFSTSNLLTSNYYGLLSKIVICVSIFLIINQKIYVVKDDEFISLKLFYTKKIAIHGRDSFNFSWNGFLTKIKVNDKIINRIGKLTELTINEFGIAEKK